MNGSSRGRVMHTATMAAHISSRPPTDSGACSYRLRSVDLLWRSVVQSTDLVDALIAENLAYRFERDPNFASPFSVVDYDPSAATLRLGLNLIADTATVAAVTSMSVASALAEVLHLPSELEIEMSNGDGRPDKAQEWLITTSFHAPGMEKELISLFPKLPGHRFSWEAESEKFTIHDSTWACSYADAGLSATRIKEAFRHLVGKELEMTDVHVRRSSGDTSRDARPAKNS